MMFWQKRTKRNSFEASMPVDNPDIKIVEAKLDKKLVFLAVGTSKQRELCISGKGSTDSVGAKYETQKEIEWKILINRENLSGFEKL
jgi:hypothetical protein